MKKLIYPIAFALTAFLILYSCSAEEEDTTPPPSVVATPEPEPQAPRQYTLTVTAGDGSFRVFNDEIISIAGITPSLIVPFFNNDKLNFIGVYPQEFLSGPDEISFRNSTLVDFYNIELNLFE
ncbi:hypothetical protein N9D15_04665 [Flavobacteriaceae bacterium]|nr:hypothetical protein [Flavobacteriaceae bacterium]